MVGFRILRGVKNKLMTMEIRGADFDLYKDLFGRIPWVKAVEGRGGQESCLIFKDHLLQAQQTSSPMNKKPGNNARSLCE